MRSVSLLNASTASFLIMGSAVVTAAHSDGYLAAISGSPMSVSADQAAGNEHLLLLGLLFMLAGFFFHALKVVYDRGHPHRSTPAAQERARTAIKLAHMKI